MLDDLLILRRDSITNLSTSSLSILGSNILCHIVLVVWALSGSSPERNEEIRSMCVHSQKHAKWFNPRTRDIGRGMWNVLPGRWRMILFQSRAFILTVGRTRGLLGYTTFPLPGLGGRGGGSSRL